MDSKQTFDPDVKARMLSAAEVVFARKGHEKASLRELTSLAAVNLAAVNYHFGSKQKLVGAVFERLSRRVNRARLERLESYVEARRRDGLPPELAEVISIFVHPYLDDTDDHAGVLLARLILQHRLSPSDLSRRIIRRHFDPMAGTFIEALCAACPHVPAADMHWRYMFMISAVVLTVTDVTAEARIARLSGNSAPTDRNALAASLLPFLTGGVGAGTPAAPGPPMAAGRKG